MADLLQILLPHPERRARPARDVALSDEIDQLAGNVGELVRRLEALGGRLRFRAMAAKTVAGRRAYGEAAELLRKALED